MADVDNTNWNVDMEVNLFHAMRRHKPVGVNRYFQMMFIHEKLNNSCSRKITPKQIWKHLSEMYDLQALNESEIIPFPNKETEFLLPVNDYSRLMEESFPRFEADGNSIEDTKSEKSDSKGKVDGKGGASSNEKKSESKSSKTDSKTTSTSHGKDSKSSSTPHGKESKNEGKSGKDSKSDSKGSSTPHGKDTKGDGKGSSTPHSTKGGKSNASQGGASASNTPESTPKRKRTRQTNSTNASPATPSDTQPTKRGRR